MWFKQVGLRTSLFQLLKISYTPLLLWRKRVVTIKPHKLEHIINCVALHIQSTCETWCFLVLKWTTSPLIRYYSINECHKGQQQWNRCIFDAGPWKRLSGAHSTSQRMSVNLPSLLSSRHRNSSGPLTRRRLWDSPTTWANTTKHDV